MSPFEQLEAIDRRFGLEGDNKPWFFAIPAHNLHEKALISNRTASALKTSKIDLIGGFRAYEIKDIGRIRGCGEKLISELETALEKVGILFLDKHTSRQKVKEVIENGHAFWSQDPDLVELYNPRGQIPRVDLFTPPENALLLNSYVDTVDDLFIKAKEFPMQATIQLPIPENSLDLANDLKKQLEAQGYHVQTQLIITRPKPDPS